MGAGEIFINYRGAADSKYAAGLLYVGLTHVLGGDRVFLDSESIKPGADFAAELLRRVRAARVILAVIGPNWLTATGTDGRRRIDDPDDWIRRELVAAFDARVSVIPVITDNATMPREVDLPADIVSLGRAQYVLLRQRYVQTDIALLVNKLLEAGLIPASVDTPGLPNTAPTLEAKPRGALRAAFGVGRPRRKVDVARLPADIRSFVGRRGEMAAVQKVLARRSGNRGELCPVLCINGGAGVGKTTLAVHIAHSVAHRYPDGCLYLDLRTHGSVPMSPSDALAELMVSLGVPAGAVPDSIAARSSLYQSKLSSTRVLIVLDNATTPDQIRPLLPRSSACLMLVAGRRPLGMLPEAAHMMLDLMTPVEARDLIVSQIGAHRVAAEESATSELIEKCGRLPLALGIASARLRSRPNWTVATLVERLSDERRRLEELRSGNVEVRSAFALSYNELTAEQAHLFRRLSLLFGAAVSDGLAGAVVDLTVDQASTLLEQLTDAQLLVASTPTHYVIHDLVRLYAAERARAEEADQVADVVTEKALAYYIDTMRVARDVMGPPVLGDLRSPADTHHTAADRQHWLTWFTGENRNVLAGVRLASARADHRAVLALATAFIPFLDVASYPREMRETAELALRAATQLGNRAALLIIREALGDAHRYLGAAAAAITELNQAVAEAQGLGDALAEGRARFTIAQVYRELHNYGDAENQYQLARRQFVAVGAFCDDAEAAIGLADIRSAQGDIDEVARLLEGALDQLTRHGQGTIQAEHKRAWAIENLGLVRQRQDRWQEAVELHTWSLSAFKDIGDRFGNAHSEANLGDAYLRARKPSSARAHYENAHDIFTDLGHTWGQAWVHKSLGDLHVARRDWTTAEHHLRRSHEFYRLAADITRHVEVLRVRAHVLRRLGRGEDAAICEAQADALAEGDSAQHRQDPAVE